MAYSVTACWVTYCQACHVWKIAYVRDVEKLSVEIFVVSGRCCDWQLGFSFKQGLMKPYNVGVKPSMTDGPLLVVK